MQFNDAKGLLAKNKKLTEEEVTVYDKFLNDLKNSCVVPNVIVNDLKEIYERRKGMTIDEMMVLHDAEVSNAMARKFSRIKVGYPVIVKHHPLLVGTNHKAMVIKINEKTCEAYVNIPMTPIHSWIPLEELTKWEPSDNLIEFLRNERRTNMNSCATCAVIFDASSSVCRNCMRGRDQNAKSYSYTRNNLKIKNVIFNPPATIVFWEDNTKTVVKAVNEEFDPEKGLAMAFMKKAMGNQGNYFNTVKKWTVKYQPDEEMIYPNIPKLDTGVSTEDFYNFLNSAFEVKKAKTDGDNTK